MSAVLVKSGGIAIDPELAQITVIRSLYWEKVWLRDIYGKPEMGIALRAGDRVMIETGTRVLILLEQPY